MLEASSQRTEKNSEERERERHQITNAHVINGCLNIASLCLYYEREVSGESRNITDAYGDRGLG